MAKTKKAKETDEVAGRDRQIEVLIKVEADLRDRLKEQEADHEQERKNFLVQAQAQMNGVVNELEAYKLRLSWAINGTSAEKNIVARDAILMQRRMIYLFRRLLDLGEKPEELNAALAEITVPVAPLTSWVPEENTVKKQQQNAPITMPTCEPTLAVAVDDGSEEKK